MITMQDKALLALIRSSCSQLLFYSEHSYIFDEMGDKVPISTSKTAFELNPHVYSRICEMISPIKSGIEAMSSEAIADLIRNGIEMLWFDDNPRLVAPQRLYLMMMYCAHDLPNVLKLTDLWWIEQEAKRDTREDVSVVKPVTMK